MTQTFTAKATCKPTVAELRDVLFDLPNHARVTITCTTDQRDGDYLTVEATWVPKPHMKYASGGLVYPPGVRGVD